MNSDQVFDDFISGRNIAGIHVSWEDGQKWKADPRYETLSDQNKRILEMIIDPKF